MLSRFFLRTKRCQRWARVDSCGGQYSMTLCPQAFFVWGVGHFAAQVQESTLHVAKLPYSTAPVGFVLTAICPYSNMLSLQQTHFGKLYPRLASDRYSTFGNCTHQSADPQLRSLQHILMHWCCCSLGIHTRVVAVYSYPYWGKCTWRHSFSSQKSMQFCTVWVIYIIKGEIMPCDLRMQSGVCLARHLPRQKQFEVPNMQWVVLDATN